MASVVFDPVAFSTEFPEFAGFVGTGPSFAAPMLVGAFNQATLFCNNGDRSVVQDITERTQLLYLLTAHITKILYGTNDGAGIVVAPTGAVGRVQIAKEGTVHVMLDMGPTTANNAWYQQTSYGAMYWAITSKYRSFRYAPGPRLCRSWGRL